MKIAVVGAAHGHLGYALSEVPRRSELELVGVVEPDRSFRAQFLSDWGHVPAYDTTEELFSKHDVDLAIVAGVYSRRAQDTLDALAAGANVLADKPLLLSLADVDAVQAAADRSNRHVSMMFEKRAHPATVAFRRLLDAGVIGDIALVASTGPHKLLRTRRPGWFLDPATYGNIAADLPIHDIDLILHFTGATTGTVSALAGNVGSEDHPGFDDHVALLLRAGGVAATMDAHWLHPEASDVHGHYRMRVCGSQGTAEIDWAYNKLTVTTHDKPRWEEPLPEEERPTEAYFNDVLAGREPEVGTRETLMATRVALLAGESARHGGVQLDW